jgi:4,5-dihydroxyphthalate decarboxylase
MLKPARITPNQSSKSLSELLETGDIQAIIGSSVPNSLNRHPDVVRLFPDYRASRLLKFGATDSRGRI